MYQATLPIFNGRNGRKHTQPYFPVCVFMGNTWFASPLNVIGLPFYDDPLLSNFSLAGYATSSSPLFNSSPAVPVNVLSNMRIIDGVGYAPLPRELKGKRNVVCKQSTANFMNSINGEEHRSVATGARGRTSHRRESGPKFRSEKNRHGEQELFEEEVCSVFYGQTRHH
jgi:PAB-dependent poly(A)-specific ribonuclease subunit 2